MAVVHESIEEVLLTLACSDGAVRCVCVCVKSIKWSDHDCYVLQGSAKLLQLKVSLHNLSLSRSLSQAFYC